MGVGLETCRRQEVQGLVNFKADMASSARQIKRKEKRCRRLENVLAMRIGSGVTRLEWRSGHFEVCCCVFWHFCGPP